MVGRQGDPSDKRMVISTIKVGRRTYEQRLNLCGKGNCKTCYPPLGEEHGRPGHGPYWYLCCMRGRRWVRVYIGKVLNTELYVGADGGVDWDQLRREKAERARKKSEKESVNV